MLVCFIYSYSQLYNIIINRENIPTYIIYTHTSLNGDQ